MVGLEVGRDGEPSLKTPSETFCAKVVFVVAVVSVGEAGLLRRNSLGGGSGTLSSSVGIEFSPVTPVVGWVIGLDNE